MLFIFLLVLIMIATFMVSRRNSCLGATCFAVCGCSVIVSIFMLCACDTRQSDAKFFKDYMFVNKYLYSDAIGDDFRQELMMKAYRLNVQIDWNKRNRTSPWFGIWTSDVKANAEKIFIIDGIKY